MTGRTSENVTAWSPAAGTGIDTGGASPAPVLINSLDDPRLSPRWLAQCDRHVGIPMRAGTDSLNVAVAAGILLYHFCGRAANNLVADAELNVRRIDR